MENSIRMLGLKLTYKCNLNCYMCGQRKLSYDEKKIELDFASVQEVVDSCNDLSYGVYLWGGEPLLYSHFEELLKYLYSKKIFVTINTNGVNLHKFEDLLCSYNGYSKIIISIDGIGQIHDKIRGIEGTYKRIEDNLKSINLKRKKNLVISSNTVITSENYSNISEIIDGISELGVDYVECQLPMFFDEKMGNAYETILDKQLKTKAESWKGFVGEYSDIEIPVLLRELEKIRKKHGRKFRLTPNLRDDEINLYFTAPNLVRNEYKCSLAFSQFNVEPNGNVVVCPDFPDVVVGNIYNQSVEQIWKSKEINSFRNIIKQSNLPICKRCCNLYQF